VYAHFTCCTIANVQILTQKVLFLFLFFLPFSPQEAVSVSMRSASLLRMLAERQPDINAANSKLVRYLKEAAAATTLLPKYFVRY
jgi:hypothetical protein